MSVADIADTQALLEELMTQRVLLLDGAMGTMVQALGLDEAGIRGRRFAGHHKDLKNYVDILCLTHPDDVTKIHRQYLAAGADIVETNTFNSSPIGMQEFDLPPEVMREVNVAAAACARAAVDEFNLRTPDRPRFVAGSIGPTAKQTAISTKVEDAAFRSVTFDEMAESYCQQAAALVEGGVDILFPETVIDTLNLKACLFGIARYFEETGRRVPVMVSGTFDRGGATFVSGQNVPAFWTSISHFPLLSVGINCALGPELMRPHLEELAGVASTYISCHPNAGLPNEMGQYDLGPEKMAQLMGEFAANGWVNIVGGCCGTTPAHIRAIAQAVEGRKPRRPPLARSASEGDSPSRAVSPAPPSLARRASVDGESPSLTRRAGVDGESPSLTRRASVSAAREHFLRLSGTQLLVQRPDSNFLMIGERTNVTGSKKFARLSRGGQFEEAV